MPSNNRDYFSEMLSGSPAQNAAPAVAVPATPASPPASPDYFDQVTSGGIGPSASAPATTQSSDKKLEEAIAPYLIDRLAGGLTAGPAGIPLPGKRPEDIATGAASAIAIMASPDKVRGPAAATAIAETGRQGIRALRAKYGEPNTNVQPLAPAFAALETAVTQSLGNLLTKAPFMEKITQGALDKVSAGYRQAIDWLAAKGAKIESAPIVRDILKAVDSTALPADKEKLLNFFAKQFGKQKTTKQVIDKARSYVEVGAKKVKTKIYKKIVAKTPEEILANIPEYLSPQQAGDLLRIMNQRFEDIFEEKIGQTAAEQFLKVRDTVSSTLKDTAVQFGRSDVPKMMARINALNKQLVRWQQAGKGLLMAGPTLGGSIGYAVGGGPAAGIGSGIGMTAAFGMVNPIAQDLLYAALHNPVSTAVTTAARAAAPVGLDLIRRRATEG